MKVTPESRKRPLFSTNLLSRRPCHLRHRLRGPKPLLLTPPDFLDHNAIVLFAVAMAPARFQHVGVNRKKRQLLPDLTGLVEHQLRVLERLAHAALGRKIFRYHFRTL